MIIVDKEFHNFKILLGFWY